MCPPEYSRALFDSLPVRDKTYVSLPGALHEPYRGESGDRFFKELDHWIEKRLIPHVVVTGRSGNSSN